MKENLRKQATKTLHKQKMEKKQLEQQATN